LGGNKDAPVWTKTYCATGLKPVTGKSGHRFDGFDHLFWRSDIPLLKNGHRLRIDGLDESRLLGRRIRIYSAGFQSKDLASCGGRKNPDRFSSRRDTSYQTAVATKANYAKIRCRITSSI